MARLKFKVIRGGSQTSPEVSKGRRKDHRILYSHILSNAVRLEDLMNELQDKESLSFYELERLCTFFGNMTVWRAYLRLISVEAREYFLRLEKRFYNLVREKTQ